MVRFFVLSGYIDVFICDFKFDWLVQFYYLFVGLRVDMVFGYFVDVNRVWFICIKQLKIIRIFCVDLILYCIYLEVFVLVFVGVWLL